MKQEAARKLLLKEWHKLSKEEQVENRMFTFWSELNAEKHPALQFRCHSDPWQTVACWLLEDIRSQETNRKKKGAS